MLIHTIWWCKMRIEIAVIISQHKMIHAIKHQNELPYRMSVIWFFDRSHKMREIMAVAKRLSSRRTQDMSDWSNAGNETHTVALKRYERCETSKRSGNRWQRYMSVHKWNEGKKIPRNKQDDTHTNTTPTRAKYDNHNVWIHVTHERKSSIIRTKRNK